MDRKEKQKRVTRVVFGLLAIGVGVIFTLDNMGILEAGRLRGYWPLLMIGFGLPSVIAPKDAGETVFGVLFTATGGFLMLRKFDLVWWNVWDVWPLFLVVAGLTLLAQSLFERREEAGAAAEPPAKEGAR